MSTPRRPAPEELAAEARAAVDAGVGSLHLHPYDDHGRQTLAAGPCAAALRTVRAACPGVPISLSTSAGIEPDPKRRRALVATWTELPDLVTANQGEEGIMALCELLAARGIGIEAGLLSLDDARAFVAAGIAPRCARAMVEPLDPDPLEAVAHAEAIERALAEGGVALEQVHHGATASPPGRSIGVPRHAATVSAPAWRPRPYCSTGTWRQVTASLPPPPPRRCWHKGDELARKSGRRAVDGYGRDRKHRSGMEGRPDRGQRNVKDEYVELLDNGRNEYDAGPA